MEGWQDWLFFRAGEFVLKSTDNPLRCCLIQVLRIAVYEVPDDRSNHLSSHSSVGGTEGMTI